MTDEAADTGFLFHPFLAYFDNRNRSETMFKHPLGDIYIRILITGQPEHLPNYFDIWNNRFLEQLNQWQCRLYYRGGDLNHTVGGIESIDIDNSGVFPSAFDFSWYPAPFATPYVAYINFRALPPPFGSTLPVALTLFRRSQERIDQAIKADICKKELSNQTLLILGGAAWTADSRRNDPGDSLRGHSPSHNTHSDYPLISHALSSPSASGESNVDPSRVAAPGGPTAAAVAAAQGIHPPGNSTASKIAVCVSPSSGIDFITGRYDSPHMFISFLNYYSAVLGVTDFIIHNTLWEHGSHLCGNDTLSTSSTECASAGPSWFHTAIHAARKSGLTVHVVPDPSTQQLHWHQHPMGHSKSRKHSSFVFPTLFPDLCIRAALHRYSHVVLVR